MFHITPISSNAFVQKNDPLYTRVCVQCALAQIQPHTYMCIQIQQICEYPPVSIHSSFSTLIKFYIIFSVLRELFSKHGIQAAGLVSSKWDEMERFGLIMIAHICRYLGFQFNFSPASLQLIFIYFFAASSLFRFQPFSSFCQSHFHSIGLFS